jgi:DNA-binding beta-propeller fold protein YncE
MLTRDQFDGSREPFEGDRTLILHSLPAGAQVTRAVIILQPVAPPTGALFEEEIVFSNGLSDRWGATKVKQAGAAGTTVPPGFVEVDFHARRTLGSVIGTNLISSALQVDLGGIFVSITQKGTIQTPSDTSEYTVDASGLLPSLATNKFKLNLQSASPDLSRVTIRSTPSNVTLRLGQQPAFFARPGELAQQETCPDFSLILQNFLVGAQVKDGFYEIPLTVHSDTICRLNVTVEVEYVQEQSPLPDGLQQATLTFDHSSTAKPGTVNLEVSIPAGAHVIPGLTTARVRGSFQNSRIVYGPTGNIQPVSSVLVNPSRAQATPLIYSSDLGASSVDLLLAATSPTAQLALDLVEDVDGKPWTRSILPEPAKLAIDSETAGKSTWVNVPLPIEVQFQKDRRYWLVLQSLQGEAAWAVGSQSSIATAASKGVWTAGAAVGADMANGSSIGAYYTDTGGLSWRQETVPEVSGTLGAFLHLRKSTAVFEVPIAIEVGEGETAQRVSLDRFQPLGRVDFSLDFDEVAEAINQVISSTGAAPPEREHLRNPEFEDWRRVGDNPREPGIRVPVGPGSVRALAASPDGKFLYMVTLTTNDANDPFKLAILDTACQELEEVKIPLGAENFYAMAVSPDGNRAYILQDDLMSWVDLEARSILGKTNELGDLFGAFGQPVFSPDGGRLYVLYSDHISIFDTAVLEKEFSGEKKLGRAVAGTIKIDSAWNPIVHVISPDNKRLYILLTGVTGDNTEAGATGSIGEIWIYMLDSKTWATPIQLGDGNQFNMAINRDGSRIIVTNAASHAITVFETRRGRRLGSISTSDTDSPSLVAVDPSGRLAYIAINETGTVARFDLSRLQLGFITPPFSMHDLPSDLEILPSGEWLYIADNPPPEAGASNFLLSAVALGAMTPLEWTLTSGNIFPYCISQPARRIAVLGNPLDSIERKTSISKPTAISQVVPVVGGNHYILSFTGVATTSDAQVEVFWYGEQCSFQQVDHLPFETIDPQGLDSPEALLLPTSRLEMISPPDASLAEVRISDPGNHFVFLDNVSLQATAGTLSNSDLQAQSNGHISGWEVAPAGVSGLTAIASSDSVTIRNAGTSVCSLRQRTTFQSEKKFNLFFDGQALTGNPSIRVEWLGANNEDLGSTLDVSLAPNSSNREERRGASPAGTQQAVLSLNMPPGAGMSVRQISLNIVEVIPVPISFVAQAPGDLVISDVRVVYEMAPSSPPGIPPNGLCPPTPLGAQPGSGSHTHCHCPNCGEDDELSNPEPTLTPAGAPALEGECSNCGARITLPGGSSQTMMAAKQKAVAPVTLAPLALQRTMEIMKPSVSKAAPTKTSPTPSPVTPTTPVPPTAESDASTLAAEMAAQPTEAASVVNEENIVAPQVSPLAHMPASIVSGVGESFSKALKRLRPPITTIEELAALDPEVEIKSIQRQRRLEIKTAAEMILAIDLNLESFAALEDESLETLLTMAPTELANRAGQSTLVAEQFQRNLRALRLLIKNDEFRNLHLSDLMKAQG